MSTIRQLKRAYLAPKFSEATRSIRVQRVPRPSQEEIENKVKQAKEVQHRQSGVLILEQNP